MMNRISTGLIALDQLLQGGFPEGSLILVVGQPGSGKTILAHQIMYHNAAADAKALYLTTLAEPQIKVLEFQQEFSFFDRDKFQTSVVYQDLGYILRQSGPASALALIDELLKKHQPRLLVVDTIKTIADMIQSPTQFRQFVLDLSIRVATWGSTMLFLGEYSEAEIENRPECAIADGILYLCGMEDRKHQKRYLRILKMRGTNYTGGETVFKITGKGVELFPRLNPDLSQQEYLNFSDRYSIGIPGLDQMLGGGIPQATTTMISGAAGTGKTILALNYAYAGLQAGESVVFVSFEEEPNQLLRTAARFGKDLSPYISDGMFRIMHVSPIELDVDEHVFRIQEQVKEYAARRLVIDSISSFEIGIQDKIKYTDYIWALTDFFKATGVTVLLTHEIHNSSEVEELSKHGISFVADNIILLRYWEIGPEIKRYIRIIKMRSSSHSAFLRELRIDNDSVTLGDNYEMNYRQN